MNAGPRGTPPLNLRAVEALALSELHRDTDEESGAEFWYCGWCDEATDTRDAISHKVSCLAGKSLALLAHCRALRAALRPFAVTVGPQEGELCLVRYKGDNVWFELAMLQWDDLNRAAAVLAQATDK